MVRRVATGFDADRGGCGEGAEVSQSVALESIYDTAADGLSGEYVDFYAAGPDAASDVPLDTLASDTYGTGPFRDQGLGQAGIEAAHGGVEGGAQAAAIAAIRFWVQGGLPIAEALQG